MRIRFLVDGFNLYHSVKSAERHLGKGPLRWLDLRGLCQTLVSNGFGPGHSLAGIHYFSALAKHLEHRKPDVVRRHRTFIEALEASGVEVVLANFKRKDRINTLADMRVQLHPFKRWFRVPASWIRLMYRAHEEKETDVAIACKLLELLSEGRCDIAVLMTGDSGLRIAPNARRAAIT